MWLMQQVTSGSDTSVVVPRTKEVVCRYTADCASAVKCWVLGAACMLDVQCRSAEAVF